MIKLSILNGADPARAARVFEHCCAASRWVRAMVENRPYASFQSLDQQAENVWMSMRHDDLMEAFAGHPKIGNLSSLKDKFRDTLITASREQAGAESASEPVLRQLSEYNSAYESKFGFIFIVFASGKSAGEMLDILKSRIHNDFDAEITIAAKEQHKITRSRLRRFIEPD
ncbi:MAG: 2-oxo-4-hydroxy-4-carboxy-5-ureidoimidazoline decarboxylase [Gammaproteobacteria bacterium]|nr:2-oxo-4-hydroxy-4-carboxy-5-ureidoimidazoline decarboxylase [Gammaproteobacteria bacterium]MYD76435.1 2-oxo-4-hydroxy-4-carboxy-5-ureidoimidazoline decarboxylase [Gammaproteobacteria bacterium]MYJ52581.1 2-oxo-4-hydroxy-4-carboxy-5-ureidoimidazoline decarboxylase [Gammaproteobacteria bacterium]